MREWENLTDRLCLLKIDGNQIRNYANELITKNEFQEEAGGTTFILNEEKICAVR